MSSRSRSPLRPAPAPLLPLVLCLAIAAGCEGQVGSAGAQGEVGAQGPGPGDPQGPQGPAGPQGPPGADTGRTIYGVDGANRLIAFGAIRPDMVFHNVPIQGLEAGETIEGIDIRPTDGVLYALGSSSRIYTIDPMTGMATAAGAMPFEPMLDGTAFGFDFNPVPDRIRTHSDARQNLRLVPGTGAVGVVDGTLTYVTGDEAAGVDPVLVGTAYTNSVPAAATTMLYAVDANRGTLVRLPDPNAGLIETVGSLGTTTTLDVGFDIIGSNGTAYVTLTSTGGTRSTLYVVELATGVLLPVGNVEHGMPLRGIAVAP